MDQIGLRIREVEDRRTSVYNVRPYNYLQCLHKHLLCPPHIVIIELLLLPVPLFPIRGHDHHNLEDFFAQISVYQLDFFLQDAVGSLQRTALGEKVEDTAERQVVDVLGSENGPERTQVAAEDAVLLRLPRVGEPRRVEDAYHAHLVRHELTLARDGVHPVSRPEIGGPVSPHICSLVARNEDGVAVVDLQKLVGRGALSQASTAQQQDVVVIRRRIAFVGSCHCRHRAQTRRASQLMYTLLLCRPRQYASLRSETRI